MYDVTCCRDIFERLVVLIGLAVLMLLFIGHV